MTDIPDIRSPSTGGEERELEGAGRILRGLSPDVQPVARHFLACVTRSASPATVRGGPPRPASIDVLMAAVQAVRRAITEAAEAGLPAQRQRVLHARLDYEFSTLARALLERTHEEARALLRDASHDLRSPLNSIVFLADALAHGHSGSLSEVQRRQVDVLYAAALSLIGLLNDLIDAAVLGDGPAVEPVEEPFSLEAILGQVEQLLSPLAAGGGVELGFRIETLGKRLGDRRILMRILINLVTNAVKATPRGGRVVVRAHGERAGWLSVTVVDAGKGADVERIRRRLREPPLPRPGRGRRGWTEGLGLSICARLVEAAGGTLNVEGGRVGGCTFTLELPFARERGTG